MSETGADPRATIETIRDSYPDLVEKDIFLDIILGGLGAEQVAVSDRLHDFANSLRKNHHQRIVMAGQSAGAIVSATSAMQLLPIIVIIGAPVAIVAPQWLQDGLAVVIKTIPRLQLVACTGSLHILLSLDFERAPDLVVLAVDAHDAKARDQIRQIKFVYPRANLVVLIQEPAQSTSARAAGAAKPTGARIWALPMSGRGN